jgi:methionyl-tRNA formyltransferase
VRIAFFGLPLAALLLVRDGHDLIQAALCRRGLPGQRRLTAALGSSRVCVRGDVRLDTIASRAIACAPDLVVSWFWTTKLPLSVVAAARLGGIGVHPSLLPRHRGPDPYFAAIDQGDLVTGVTAHRIAEEYDTGAMLGKREVVIDPSWNAWQLARKLDGPSIALLRDTVRKLAEGAIDEEAQDDSAATWAPSPPLSACAIRWSWRTDAVIRRVRALAPSPGAFTEIDGNVVTLLRVAPSTRYPRALEPGEAAIVDGKAVVKTQDGAVELLAGEIDGLAADENELARLIAHNRNLVIG